MMSLVDLIFVLALTSFTLVSLGIGLWLFGKLMKPKNKNYHTVTMNVCNYCGLKALREEDMFDHLQNEHSYEVENNTT